MARHENAGPKNDTPNYVTMTSLKMTDLLKLHDMKVTDQMEGRETDGAKVELTSSRFTPSTS